jgi:hypothetical protein
LMHLYPLMELVQLILLEDENQIILPSKHSPFSKIAYII